MPEPFPEPVLVTRPLLPPLERYVNLLATVWKSGWITNAGEFHERLEAALSDRLQTRNLSLWNNGTTALMGALRGLDVTGEVITTPFTFPATVHALAWLGLKPVFADIDEACLTISPAAVAAAANGHTTAVLGVHVYGIPCDTAGLATVAATHGLRVLYDSAHSFVGSAQRADAIGDATMFSFHATKVFHSAEGGAVVTRNAEVTRRLKLLRNFGIEGEDSFTDIGINGKMNELQAALGLLVLEEVPHEIERRARIARAYSEALSGIGGVSLVGPQDRADQQFLAVRVDSSEFGKTRDTLYEALRARNIICRRYFSPLISHLEPYRGAPSADPANLPNAERAASECLVLPLHGDLTETDAERICETIRYVQSRSTPG